MKKFLVVALSAFLLTACESKDSYMNDFESFIEKVQEKSDSFTESDWKKADDQFSKFTGSSYEKYAAELSNEEKLQIAKIPNHLCRIQSEVRHEEFWRRIERCC